MPDLVTIFQNLSQETQQQRIANVADILLVAYLIYRLLMLVRGTQFVRIVAGIIFFLIIYYLSEKLGLGTLHWLLEKSTILGPLALVILLYPELRAFIEGFTPQASIWQRTLNLQKLVNTRPIERLQARTVEEIVAAVAELAADRTGALIVIEKLAPLDEYIGNGVRLDAVVSSALLESIFFENNPLHDGAVIIRGDTLLAAASRLPLSASKTLDTHVHMRHRAAVGVTEDLDCLSIVVSEERGTISVASEGVLRRLGSHAELRTLLNKELRNIEEMAPAERRQNDRRKKARVAD